MGLMAKLDLRNWERSWQIRLNKLRRWGWCPLCNSSPPRKTCPVCMGSYDYGPSITDELKLVWERRWCLQRTEYVRIGLHEFRRRHLGD